MTAIEFNKSLTDLKQVMHYFALSLTRNSAEAEDLTQETCLKALKYKKQFRANTNFKAWLLTIMKNTFINQYNRKVRHRALVDSSETNEALIVNKVDHFASPEKHYYYDEIKQGISDLKDDYGVPFQMHLDGYKYKEIAEELDIPIGTVKSRIYLAKQILIDKFKDHRN